MSSASQEFHIVPIRIESLSDYKIRRPPPSPLIVNVVRSKPKSPIHIDDSFHVLIRAEEKSNVNLKKKSSTGKIEQEKARNSVRPVSWPIAESCDLRFFIIRHGERVDRYFGPNWFMFAFDPTGQYRPYHNNLPPQLPNRSNRYFWAADTPLTRDGMNGALNVGRVLGLNQYEPGYVYSSPATRCIMTAHQILKGLGLENQISIRIEPGLLELGAARYGMEVFFTPIEWRNFGINVDTSYRPILTSVPPIETEGAYYLRSKHIVRELEQHHSSSPSSLNVLLVGHATSPETLTWDLVGRQPNVSDLFTLSLNIGYLQMVITERQRQNRSWTLKHIPLQSTTLKWV